MALHGMAHSFTELHKPLHHDKAVIHEGVKDQYFKKKKKKKKKKKDHYFGLFMVEKLKMGKKGKLNKN